MHQTNRLDLIKQILSVEKSLGPVRFFWEAIENYALKGEPSAQELIDDKGECQAR